MLMEGGHGTAAMGTVLILAEKKTLSLHVGGRRGKGEGRKVLGLCNAVIPFEVDKVGYY